MLDFGINRSAMVKENNIGLMVHFMKDIGKITMLIFKVD